MNKIVKILKSWIISLKEIFGFKDFDSDNHSYLDFKFVIDTDEPESFEKGKIYILGKNSNYWQISFLCPCGCNDEIHLNLLSESYPYWTFYVSPNISINPSVWRTKGCKSHFWIKEGKVFWV